MDPISAMSLAITLGTFVKDVVELARSIERSIEKVGQNKRKLKRLSHDIVATLVDLQELYSAHEEEFQHSQELARAMQRLRDDMLLICESCRKLMPIEEGGRIAVMQAKFKAYRKRDDIEEEIQHLKEHVSNCYAKFTAFSAARTESASIRVEHQLVVRGVETRAKLNRLDVMVTQMLLDTPQGERAIQSILTSIDARGMTFDSDNVEVQFLQLQFTRVSELFEHMAATRQFVVEDPNGQHATPFQLVAIECEDIDDLVTRILRMKRQLTEQANELTFQEGAMALHDLSLRLPWTMGSQQILVATWATRLYRVLTRKSPEFLPWLAHTLTSLSRYHLDHGEHDKALTVAEESCRMWDVVLQTNPEQNYRSASVYAVATRGLCLMKVYRHEEALKVLQPVVGVYKDLLEHVDDEDTIYDDDQKFSIRMRHQWAFNDYADCLLHQERPWEALAAVCECIRSFEHYSHPSSINNTELHMNRAFSALYREKELRFVGVQEILEMIHDVSLKAPTIKKLYTNLVQRFALVCQDGVDLIGTVLPAKDIWGVVQNPFEHELTWMSRSFSSVPEVPRLMKEYVKAREMTIHDLLADLLAVLLQSEASTLLDYNLLVLLAREYEDAAMTAFDEVFAKFVAEQSTRVDWVSVHYALRTFSQLYSTLQDHAVATFASKLLAMSMQLTEFCVSTAPEESIMQFEVAVAVRLSSNILVQANQQDKALACIDHAVSIFRRAIKLDNYRRGDFIETLNTRSDFLQRTRRYEECLADAREAYNLAKESFGSSDGVVPAVYASDISRLVRHTMCNYYFPQSEELFEYVDTFIQAYHMDPPGMLASAPIELLDSILTVALRAQRYKRHDLVRRCIAAVSRIWRVQNTWPDSITLSTVFALVTDVCWSLPPGDVADLVTEVIEMYWAVSPPLPAPITTPCHPLSFVYGKSLACIRLPGRIRGVASHSLAFSSLYSLTVVQDSFVGVAMALAYRAATLGLEDAVLLRREVVRIHRCLYDKGSTLYGHAVSLMDALRALILTLELRGGSEEEIETRTRELEEVFRAYPDLDDVWSAGWSNPVWSSSPPPPAYDDIPTTPSLRPGYIQEVLVTPPPEPASPLDDQDPVEY